MKIPFHKVRQLTPAQAEAKRKIRSRLEEMMMVRRDSMASLYSSRAYEIGLTLPDILRLPPGPERTVLLGIHKHVAESYGVIFEDGWLEAMSRSPSK